MNKITAFFNGLGYWNHAVVALFATPLFWFIFSQIGTAFAAAFTITIAYVFREVTHAQASGVSMFAAINPKTWPSDHDRIQTLLTFVVACIVATIITII